MFKTVDISKKVVKKEDINRLVNKDISFFVNEVSQQESINVEEFFQIYDRLYFEIPIEGATNSHEYLVKTSSELYKLDEDITNLQPLLDEISQLRARLLEANNTILELENKLNS